MWQARWMLSLSLLAVRAFQAPRSSVGRRTTRGLAASTLPAEVVFENINVFGLVKRTMAAATHLKPGTLKKVAKAMPADDFVAVVAFFLVLDPALNLMWRLRGGSRSFNDSWFGTLRPALKLLSSVFGTLYALDVLYCASCLIGNPLPNVIPAVAAGIGYTAVGGVLTTSIKDRFLEPRLMPVSGRSSRARNFAVKRGSGIAIWLVCILVHAAASPFEVPSIRTARHRCESRDQGRSLTRRCPRRSASRPCASRPACPSSRSSA